MTSKLKKTSLSVVLALISLGNGMAATTFNLTYILGELAGLTAGVSKAILVVDTANDGFTGISSATSGIAGFSLTRGSQVGNDMVLAVFTAVDVSGGSNKLGFQTAGGNPVSIDTADTAWNPLGLTAGAKLGLYYFPTGSNALTNAFGFYRSDVSGPDGTLGYFVPAIGTTQSIISATTSAGGSGNPFTGTPSVSGTIGAAPEPSRMILMGLGLGAFFLRRRRMA